MRREMERERKIFIYIKKIKRALEIEREKGIWRESERGGTRKVTERGVIGRVTDRSIERVTERGQRESDRGIGGVREGYRESERGIGRVREA